MFISECNTGQKKSIIDSAGGNENRERATARTRLPKSLALDYRLSSAHTARDCLPRTSFSEPVWRRPADASSLHAPVEHGEETDVAIVGGGILGLSTALHAARRGLSVRVVEAKELGEGASGLNGGQVIPGLKYD